jgi:hypothetical protein
MDGDEGETMWWPLPPFRTWRHRVSLILCVSAIVCSVLVLVTQVLLWCLGKPWSWGVVFWSTGMILAMLAVWQERRLWLFFTLLGLALALLIVGLLIPEPEESPVEETLWPRRAPLANRHLAGGESLRAPRSETPTHSAHLP